MIPIQRLFSIFQNVTQSMPSEESKLHYSKHWLKNFSKRIFTEENLYNFRGINNAPYQFKHYLSQGLDPSDIEINMIQYIELQDKMGYEYIHKNLFSSNIGNSPNVFKFGNKLADSNTIRMISWLYDLENSIEFQNIFQNEDIPVFLEIGGGYGEFARLLLSNYNIKLISIDLPESNCLTTYYLSQNFPDKKFFLYDDYSKKNILTKSDILDNDILILPNHTRFDDDITFDFSMNARSMMEMNSDAIDYYYNLVQKHSKVNSLFLTINRYEKSTVGEKIRIAEYPYDDLWETLISKATEMERHIHMLLTKRLDHSNSDISKNLDEINLLGKPFYSY